MADPGSLETLINYFRSQVTVLRSVTMIALSALKENTPVSAAQPELEAAARRKTA